MNVGYIIGNDRSITLVYNNKPHMIAADHINYDKILEALNEERFDVLDSLIDIPTMIASASNGGISVNEHGVVTYNGNPLHNVVTSRIADFIRQGLPFKPLVNFLGNLMKNPSNRSVEELYSFLEHRGMAITPDGCFLAYKGIREDWMDGYSGTVRNKIGDKPSMDRNQVDDNCNNTCSKGYHVGSHEYASNWARTSCGANGRVVLVKVNPADAVSVPADHNAQKLRVTTYEVIAEAPAAPLAAAVYDDGSDEGYDGDDEGDDFCDGCFDSGCECNDT